MLHPLAVIFLEARFSMSKEGGRGVGSILVAMTNILNKRLVLTAIIISCQKGQGELVMDVGYGH